MAALPGSSGVRLAFSDASLRWHDDCLKSSS
jgi:hypothetical protein